jgi:hypothetical protein
LRQTRPGAAATAAEELHSEKLTGYDSIVDESGRHGSSRAENCRRKIEAHSGSVEIGDEIANKSNFAGRATYANGAGLSDRTSFCA